MVRRYHTGLARRLGQNLAHYRRRAGLTQEQLAEHIEVEIATVSRYETGATLRCYNWPRPSVNMSALKEDGSSNVSLVFSWD